jgi:DNA (cytosine-5)-methyltransferase 1
MVRAALNQLGWRCLFANDFDAKKVATYEANWGTEIWHGDVRQVRMAQLPGVADLVWASFPCQDLSLAGGGAGLKGDRSGTFWPFWKIICGLAEEGRKPPSIVLENVCGTLTSHGGKDFAAICGALGSLKYNFGALVIDASLFLPQSRPRVFFVAIDEEISTNHACALSAPGSPWHTPALVRAYNDLGPGLKARWVWWSPPVPSAPVKTLESILESGDHLTWHTQEETQRFLEMMAVANRKKIDLARKNGGRVVGTLYRRTRATPGGSGVQRAEVRFDGVAGCLRTPAGGSSRQTLVIVESGIVRTRLLSAREAARLMGLDEDYKLPARYNEAYHLAGDGVAVPAVAHIVSNVIGPQLRDHPERKVA